MTILAVTSTDRASAGLPSVEAIERMNAFIEELKTSGVLVDTGGRNPAMLELTVARKDGATTVIDGPYAETKELVGGFALMNVHDRDEALILINRFLDIIGDATCRIHEVELV